MNEEINYEELNEEFGDVDISDEEEQIEKENLDTKSNKGKLNQQNKYEKIIKNQFSGTSYEQRFQMPNYFLCFGVGNKKITKMEEQEGTKLFISKQSDKDKQQKNNQSKNFKNIHNSKRIEQKKSKSKGNKTDIEDYDDNDDYCQMERDAADSVDNLSDDDMKTTIIKNIQLKNYHMKNLIQQNFTKIKFMLDCGFNILVYGVGSKVDFLNLFCQKHIIQNHYLLIFNGYHNSCSVKSIVKKLQEFIEKEIFEKQKKTQQIFSNSANIYEKVNIIKQQFAKINKLQQGDNPTIDYSSDNFNEMSLFDYRKPGEFERIYILIHSLDAGSLKTESDQDLLADIAQIPQIKMIISVDNFAANRLWNNIQLDKFQFYQMQIDTFQPYDKEYLSQPDLFSVKNENQEIGLQFILRSMTRQQRQIIQIIAKHQLNSPEEKGIKAKELLDTCVEEMLANNQKHIRDQLNEAKEHKVIIERTDENGLLHYYMNYPPHLLEKVISDSFFVQS